MAFSTNLRGLRSVAMAVLVSGAALSSEAAVIPAPEKAGKKSFRNIFFSNKSIKNRLPNA